MLSSTLPNALLALGFVVLLAYGGERLFRRFGPFHAPSRPRPSSEQRLSIRSSLALDPRRRLVVFSCDRRDGLLLVSATGESFLGWLSPADTAAITDHAP